MSPPELQKHWRERVVRALNAAFPDVIIFNSWMKHERLLPYVVDFAALTVDELTPTLGVAELLYKLCDYLYYRGEYSLAEPLLLRVISIYEQLLGAEHSDTVTALNNLAILNMIQRKYSQTGLLHQKALAIREKYLGTEHLDIAWSILNLAVLYHEQGKYVQAIVLNRLALTLRDKYLRAEHPDIALTLYGLAKLLQDQVQHEHTEALYHRALSVQKQLLGTTHPKNPKNQGRLCGVSA
jgi:tetratricopeptide (TPR) repeat protein